MPAAVLLRFHTRGGERDQKKEKRQNVSGASLLCFAPLLPSASRLVVWRPPVEGILRVKRPGGVLQEKEMKDEGAQTQNRITDVRLDYKLKMQLRGCC